ncbi:hypothetical protein ES704_03701 [subsurface metagenome]|jgi:hypothetical protein
MGGCFSGGSNWLQLRPPLIPTQTEKHLSLRNRRIATIHYDLGNYERGGVKCVNIAPNTERERSGICR